MTTRGFGMGFFGRNPFDMETKKKFQQEWSKMTDNEKLDFMNKRVENMGKGCFCRSHRRPLRRMDENES